MGFFEQLFAERTEREKLWARASAVGDPKEVLELGIRAAQLGLTPDMLQTVVRYYYIRQYRGNT